jgi:hypothetical protein
MKSILAVSSSDYLASQMLSLQSKNIRNMKILKPHFLIFTILTFLILCYIQLSEGQGGKA